MDMKPSTVFGLVAIVFIMMAGAITLRVFGEDISIIITLVTVLAVPVLAAFGVKMHEGLQEIKANTNGRNDKQTEFLQQNQLAMQESVIQFQKAMQENVLQLQRTVAELALQMTPPPVLISTELTKELGSDNTSSVHLPG
jgi:hypothetical protein